VARADLGYIDAQDPETIAALRYHVQDLLSARALSSLISIIVFGGFLTSFLVGRCLSTLYGGYNVRRLPLS